MPINVIYVYDETRTILIREEREIVTKLVHTCVTGKQALCHNIIATGKATLPNSERDQPWVPTGWLLQIWQTCCREQVLGETSWLADFWDGSRTTK